LMLLGELGFIGVFIGGGAFAELEIDLPPYHYSDVPEWGALLSNVRVYARSYVWTALYPALAFFVAILGFNRFGEGVRRLLESVGVGISRLVNRYTVGLAALAIVAFGWAQGNAGATAYYRRQAAAFDGRRALAHAQFLAGPELDGRALGAPGLESAANYIAGQFESLGLQPAGEKGTFLYRRTRSFEQLDAVPQFSLDDGGPAPLYGRDYRAYPGQNRNLGQAGGTVRFIATGPLSVAGATFVRTLPALKGMAYPDEILMVPTGRDARLMERIPRGGLLVVTGDESVLGRNYTLSSRDPLGSIYGTGRNTGQDAPVLWINEATADRLLQGSGQTIAGLRLLAEGLIEDQLIDFATPHRVKMGVAGTVVDRFAVHHVIGYLPGASAAGFTKLDDRLIIVMAQYDTPPPEPDGAVAGAGGGNAGGVAVMLEAIRAMQVSGYQPNRTFLFVAYSAEGREGGESVAVPDPKKLLQAKIGFASAYTIEAIVEVRELDSGGGETLMISGGGSRRLAGVFERAAGQMGLKTVRVDDAVDFNQVFEPRNSWQSGQEAPKISLGWEGEEAASAAQLQKAGRALSLALMVLGREMEY
ncbi:MAG: M28 family peptidase, partial [Anaerolineae bacterium]